jgi:hypothetical protein
MMVTAVLNLLASRQVLNDLAAICPVAQMASLTISPRLPQRHWSMPFVSGPKGWKGLPPGRP